MPVKGVLALIFAMSLCMTAAQTNAEMFEFTITNVGVQPITPAFVATHDATVDIFDGGAAASAALEAIAEAGDTALMEALAGGSAGVFDFDVGDFIMPGESTTVMVTADPAHPYLSFAAMLPVTNDAFIGLAYGDGALDLFRLDTPSFYDFTLSFMNVWDAGTEVNTELADDVPALGGSGSPDEGGVVTRPHPGILGVGDVGPEFDFFGLDVAHVTVIPEPAALIVLAIAGLGCICCRR